MSFRQRVKGMLGLTAQPTRAKTILILAFLAILGVIIFGAFKLEPHYLSSKEAFLGNFYRGKIIPFVHDNEKAKEYLVKAVEKNNTVEAQCDIGEIYAEENNYKRAAAYYLMGVRDGSQRCELYFLRLSFPDYEDKVFQLLKNMADEIKIPSAQFMVGIRLINGVGVSKNSKEGIAYLEKAVAQNHRGASVYLAGIYIKGELLPQDIDKANKLMESNNKIGENK